MANLYFIEHVRISGTCNNKTKHVLSKKKNKAKFLIKNNSATNKITNIIGCLMLDVKILIKSVYPFALLDSIK